VRREGTFKLAARLFSFVEIAAIDWATEQRGATRDAGAIVATAEQTLAAHRGWLGAAAAVIGNRLIFDGNDVKHLLCEQSHYAVRCFSSHALLPSTVNRKKLRRFRGAGKNCILETHR